jgi:uncharacterized coiled-coil DUF342 family protein
MSNLLKLEKKLEETFVDSVRSLSEGEMKDKVVSLSQELEKVSQMQKEDVKLNELKDQLKDFNGGYNDSKKEFKKRIQYLLLLLESKGKL